MTDGSRAWRKLVLMIVALALVIGGIVYFRGAAEESSPAASDDPEERAEARAPERTRSGKQARRAEEFAARSRQLREAMRLARERAAAEGGDEEAEPEEPTPQRTKPELGPRQQRVMQLAYESLYDPEELWDSVNRGDAGQTAREMSRRFAEIYSADTLSDGHGQVPVDDELRTAVRELRVLSGYAANVLHAQRPGQSHEKLVETIERLNDNWAPRFDKLNADYPFLEAKMVEP